MQRLLGECLGLRAYCARVLWRGRFKVPQREHVAGLCPVSASSSWLACAFSHLPPTATSCHLTGPPTPSHPLSHILAARRSGLSLSTRAPASLTLSHLLTLILHLPITLLLNRSSKKYAELVKKSDSPAPAPIVTLRKVEEPQQAQQGPVGQVVQQAQQAAQAAAGFVAKPAVQVAGVARANQQLAGAEDEDEVDEGSDWETASEEEMQTDKEVGAELAGVACAELPGGVWRDVRRSLLDGLHPCLSPNTPLTPPKHELPYNPVASPCHSGRSGTCGARCLTATSAPAWRPTWSTCEEEGPGG